MNPTIEKKRMVILHQDQMNLLKEAFDLFDVEKTGKIDDHELKLTLKAFGFKMKKTNILDLIKKLDSVKDETSSHGSNSNKISYDEFLEIMTHKFSERDQKEEASMAFDLFDEEKIGKIDIYNLQKVVKEIDESLNDEELQAIIDEFDTDGDGYISKEDYLKIMEEYYFY